MTEKETVEIIIKTLAEALADKNDEICVLKSEAEALKMKLAAAEKAARELNAIACGKLCKTRIESRR